MEDETNEKQDETAKQADDVIKIELFQVSIT